MNKLLLTVALMPFALSCAMAQMPSNSDSSSYSPDGFFPGVNISAAEFGRGTTLYKNFVYPNDKEFAYFQSKGFKIVRIPFKWERVQPKLMGDLDPQNLKELDRCVSQANQDGLVVLLDVHNYGGRDVNGQGAMIGRSPDLTNDQFNDFWLKLGGHFKDKPMVWIGLMNEPHVQTAEETAGIMQSAVNAIRAAGIQNRILVPGTSWTGAHSWISSGNGAAYENFKDPGNNFAFEVHQYLDKDNSGTHPEAVEGSGSSRLVDFTGWAKDHHFKAFLGEFGWDGNPSDIQADIEGDALLSYMDQNKDVWIGYTYWAAGPWWKNYMYSVEPDGLKAGAPVDKNQMSVLTKHL
jgi:endoglucanase